MTVALVTDSTAYLPEDLRRAHGIAAVPLHVVVGGKEYSEGVDITALDVAAALRRFAPVTTSRPAPQAFLDAYQAAADAGATAVVSVHISADLSSTLGSAQLAATEAPVPVQVVDSRTMGMAMGYAVLSGARMGRDGATQDEVVEHVKARCAASRVFFYVDTLEHLRRGGRIGAASAFLGSALAIKPILALSRGVIAPVEKVRTSSRALSRLEELAVTAAQSGPEGSPGLDVTVHHLDAEDRAEALTARLRDRLAERFGDQVEVALGELGAVVGAHVGPGTIAVAVSPRLVTPT